MTTRLRPLSAVNHDAIKVLTEHLGVVDAMRFVNQFTTGHGNYTKERDALLGHLTLDEVVTAIEKARPAEGAP